MRSRPGPRPHAAARASVGWVPGRRRVVCEPSAAAPPVRRSSVDVGARLSALREVKDEAELHSCGRRRDRRRGARGGVAQGLGDRTEARWPGPSSRRCAAAAPRRSPLPPSSRRGRAARCPRHSRRRGESATATLVVARHGRPLDGYHSDITRTSPSAGRRPGGARLRHRPGGPSLPGLAAVRGGVEACTVDGPPPRGVIEAAGYGERFGPRHGSRRRPRDPRERRC